MKLQRALDGGQWVAIDDGIRRAARGNGLGSHCAAACGEIPFRRQQAEQRKQPAMRAHMFAVAALACAIPRSIHAVSSVFLVAP